MLHDTNSTAVWHQYDVTKVHSNRNHNHNGEQTLTFILPHNEYQIHRHIVTEMRNHVGVFFSHLK